MYCDRCFWLLKWWHSSPRGGGGGKTTLQRFTKSLSGLKVRLVFVCIDLRLYVAVLMRHHPYSDTYKQRTFHCFAGRGCTWHMFDSHLKTLPQCQTTVLGWLILHWDERTRAIIAQIAANQIAATGQHKSAVATAAEANYKMRGHLICKWLLSLVVTMMCKFPSRN